MVNTIYAFLRRAIPISPSRPEPNSHTAAGTGTADTSGVVQLPGAAYMVATDFVLLFVQLAVIVQVKNCAESLPGWEPGPRSSASIPMTAAAVAGSDSSSGAGPIR